MHKVKPLEPSLNLVVYAAVSFPIAEFESTAPTKSRVTALTTIAYDPGEIGRAWVFVTHSMLLPHRQIHGHPIKRGDMPRVLTFLNNLSFYMAMMSGDERVFAKESLGKWLLGQEPVLQILAPLLPLLGLLMPAQNGKAPT